MRRGRALKAMFGASFATIAGCAAGAPTVNLPRAVAQSPTRFGSQIYEVDDLQRAADLIAACGGNYVRVSSQVSIAYLDAVMTAASARGLRVVLLSAYAPQPVDINAYAASAAALHARYAAANPVWEIWNEPNLEAYWGAAPSVSDYLRLLAATGSALRAVGATDIWTGGTSGVDLNWIYNLIAGGAFTRANGCAVHSYKLPGFARTEYVQAIDMMPRGVQVHTTETCVSSDDNDQADFFRQMWYLHREFSLPTMIWCELRDGTAGARPPYTSPYGLVTSDYQFKNVFYAAKATIATTP